MSEPRDSFPGPDPLVSQADAAALLSEHYGLRGDIERLGGERDQNFGARVGLRRFVLKISHSAESAEAADLQTRVLQQLAMADPTLPVPGLIPDREGASQAVWTGPDGRSRTVRLLSFLQGEPLRRAARAPKLLGRLGALAARVNLALADMRHPAEQSPLLWDLQQVDRVLPLLSAVPDPATRRLAQSGLERLVEANARGAALRRQLIHNDLNLDNVLSDGREVTGVLDFGDAVRSPLIQELAVAASYQLGDDEDPLGGAAALARGYHAVTPLHDDEIALLPALIVGRLAVSVTVTAWSAARQPDNRAYLTRNAGAALAGLRRLSGASGARAADALARSLTRMPA